MEVNGMVKHASLFSGIGGFDLAAAWCGWENVFQVEIDDFCQKVLAKNFPNVKRYGDIKQFDGTIYKGRIDVLSGGFPCQPFSQAGKRKGKDDDRFLWHEMLRAIREIQPTWIVAENVSGLLTLQNGLVFEQVCVEMEKENYEIQPFIIPACALNAPHRRDRIWIIANNVENAISKRNGRRNNEFDKSERNGMESKIQIERSDSNASNSHGIRHIHRKPKEQSAKRGKYAQCEFEQCDTNVADTKFKRLERRMQSRLSTNSNKWESWEQIWIEVATEFCRVDARIPDRVDRLKGLGNAIVPQVAYEIFKAIENTKIILTR